MIKMIDDKRKNEAGMTMLAIMLIMAVAAIALMAAAPAIQQEVQREKELEAIQRGEDIAHAIRR